MKLIRLPVCTHDLAERETECADGGCPICLAKELTETKRLLHQSMQLREELKHDRRELSWALVHLRDAFSPNTAPHHPDCQGCKQALNKVTVEDYAAERINGRS
jgi:hypothetical protein